MVCVCVCVQLGVPNSSWAPCVRFSRPRRPSYVCHVLQPRYHSCMSWAFACRTTRQRIVWGSWGLLGSPLWWPQYRHKTVALMGARATHQLLHPDLNHYHPESGAVVAAPETPPFGWCAGPFQHRSNAVGVWSSPPENSTHYMTSDRLERPFFQDVWRLLSKPKVIINSGLEWSDEMGYDMRYL